MKVDNPRFDRPSVRLIINQFSVSTNNYIIFKNTKAVLEFLIMNQNSSKQIIVWNDPSVDFAWNNSKGLQLANSLYHTAHKYASQFIKIS